jgi:hypothetical protein
MLLCFNQTSEPFVPKVKIKSTISVTFLQDNIKILGKFHIFHLSAFVFHLFSVLWTLHLLAGSGSCRIQNFLARSDSDLNNCSESGSDNCDKNRFFCKFYNHISLENPYNALKVLEQSHYVSHHFCHLFR